MLSLGLVPAGPSGGSGSGPVPDPTRFVYFGQTPAGTLGNLPFPEGSFTEGFAGVAKSLTFNPLVAGSFLFIAVPATLELVALSQLPDVLDILASWDEAPLAEELNQVSYTGFTRGPTSIESAGTSVTYSLTLATGA